MNFQGQTTLIHVLRTAAIGLAAVLVLALAAAAPASADTTGTIAGTVKDTSGNVLSGICVSAAPSTGGSATNTTTDSTGAYSLTLVGNQSYVVAFTACVGGGYSPTTISGVGVDYGKTTKLNVTLTPAGTITGTVTNTSGAPVQGACVSANPASGGNQISARTSSTGTYAINSLAAGGYIVTAYPCAGGNYAPATVSGVWVTAGASTTANPVLPPGATVAGTVTDTSGKPLSGACVSVAPTNGGNAGADTTASDGTYSVGGLAAGNYTVAFSACSAGDYLPTTVNNVSPTAGGKTTLNATLTSGGSIVGRLLDSSGAELPGVCVNASPSGGGPGGGFATTSSTGYYSVARLTTGTYTVTFSACAAGNYTSETVTGVNVSTTTNTVVNGTLQPGGIISGTVTNASGTPLAGACATASPSGGGPSLSATTNTSGVYSITGLNSGTYVITFAGCSAGGYVSQTVTGAAVAAGSTTTENGTLTPDGKIVGVVRDSLGAKLPNICVTATPSSPGPGGYADSGSQGKSIGAYTISDLAPGSYTVTFTACSANDYAPKTVTGVIVNAGANTTVNTTLAPGGTISGKVTDKSGNALAGACVTATPSDGSPGQSTSTSTLGNYWMHGLAAGTYTVTFSGCSAGEYVPQTVTETVTAGQTTTARAALTPGGMISGTVSDTSGRPLSGACVSASASNGGPTSSATTDSTGSYSLVVAAGTYTVSFTGCAAGTYSPETVNGVTVTTGASTTENGSLSPG